MANLVAGVFMAFGAFLHGIIGGHASTTLPVEHPPMASSTASSTMPHRMGKGMGSTSPEMRGMPGMHGILGQVTVVNGTSFTVLGKDSLKTATSTYTVDASKAKIIKGTIANATTADIKVGDLVLVDGSVTGASVAAMIVLDGHDAALHPVLEKIEGRDRTGSSTMQHMNLGENGKPPAPSTDTVK